MKIAISFTSENLRKQAKSLADKWQLAFVEIDDINYDYLLILTEQRLELRSMREKKLKPIAIDFLAGKMQQRSQQMNKRNELIARAIGIKNKKNLSVLDLTAGLGNDAFVLACLGAEVTMIERSPVIAALLEDGLARIKQTSGQKKFILELLFGDAKNYLLELKEENYSDIIYLDPMFPVTKKSAEVKKEMRILRNLVGTDEDAAQLFELALPKARERVVVKRHYSAPFINDQKPDLIFKGSSSRFDVYLTLRG